MRSIVLSLILVFSSGCTYLPYLFENRDQEHRVHSINENALKDKKAFVWKEPVVQNVRFPNMVIGGVMIPAHETPVVVFPGEIKFQHVQEVEKTSPSKEEKKPEEIKVSDKADIHMIAYNTYTKKDKTDVVTLESVKHLVKGSPHSIIAFSNGDILIINDHAYKIRRDSTDYIVETVNDKYITKLAVRKGEGIFTKNGLIFKFLDDGK
ncbi:MAG: hypothetical protein AB1488_06690 [Nitrospirota bacterium]